MANPDNTLPDFEDADLAERVEHISAEDVNRLSFGAIRLDSGGKVTVFNDAEHRLSGYGKQASGRIFFTEIAPCMNNPNFRGRIERAMATGKLDIRFGHVGDFNDLSRELAVRVQSVSGGGCWIFLQRED